MSAMKNCTGEQQGSNLFLTHVHIISESTYSMKFMGHCRLLFPKLSLATLINPPETFPQVSVMSQYVHAHSRAIGVTDPEGENGQRTAHNDAGIIYVEHWTKADIDFGVPHSRTGWEKTLMEA